MATDCSHGMPSPSSCLDCMEAGNLPSTLLAGPGGIGPDTIAVRPTATARFEGKCSACSWVIEIDDDLVLSDSGEWIHAECGGRS